MQIPHRMKMGLFLGNSGQNPLLSNLLIGWAQQQIHSYESLYALLDRLESTHVETVIIIRVKDHKVATSKKLKYLAQNRRIRFLLISQANEINNQILINDIALSISERSVCDYAPIIKRWLNQPDTVERQFVRVEFNGSGLILPSRIVDSVKPQSEMQAQFCNITRQGAQVQIYGAQISENTFIRVQYLAAKNQIVTLESQVRWVQQIQHISKLGLRFLAFSS